MIKKLLLLLLIFSLLQPFIFSNPSFAINENCNIETPSAYVAGSNSVTFKVNNTGLSSNQPYYAHVRISLTESSALHRYSQEFRFNSNPKEITFQTTQLLVGTGLKVHISINTTNDWFTGKECVKSVPIAAANSGQSCILQLSGTAGGEGFYSTNSLISIRAEGFASGLNGPFRIQVWEREGQNIVGKNDTQGNVTKTVLERNFGSIPGPPFVAPAPGRNFFEAGNYIITLHDNADIIHNYNHRLCEVNLPITQEGTDDPDPISGGGSCQFCPWGTRYQPNTNPPICIDQNGSEVSPTRGNCTNQQACDSVFGCVDKISGNPLGEDPGDSSRTPPCSVALQNGICPEIATGLGVSFPTTIAGFSSNLLGVVLSLVGGLALILIIISGYRIMGSQGNPEQLQAAREQLTAAIVGLLFVIFSLVILQVIGFDILRLPTFGQ